ncbi:MAG TPA: hypothetical protein VE685_19580 [Thermoanaerobaculia bacterium]|nr:hypothetical protein [Thermoanaerobaculia bacterium]
MGPTLLRSPELRIVAAAAVAATCLGLAVLEVVAARTDLLMLDLREWRPVGSRPDAAAVFKSAQTAPSDLRPLQLDLRLARPGSPSDFLAAERTFEVDGDGCYRFRVYVWSPTPIHTAKSIIAVNDEIAWSAPLAEASPGKGVSIEGVRPRQGTVEVRLELRADPVRASPAPRASPASPASPAPSVRFEYAVLRQAPCGEREEGAGG